MSKNTPCSQAEFEKYPPGKYPLHLYLFLGSSDAYLVDELKEILNRQPGEVSRYRKTVLKHVGNCITLNCYFKHVDALRPVAMHLQGQNLWKSTVQAEDKPLSPRLLIEEAQSVFRKEKTLGV